LTSSLGQLLLSLGALGPLVLFACSNQPREDEPPSEDTTQRPTANSAAVVTGTAPRAFGGFPSVIILEPEIPMGLPVPPIPEEPAVMDQYNTEFHPRLLLVRVGQTVQFKNSEDTLHNVHVIDIETRDTAFNIATPVTGAYEYVFENASVYDVSCGIHPSMAAFVFVTESALSVVAENDGAFSLSGVPPGNYKVTVWSLDPSQRSEHVVVIAIDDAAIELNLAGMS